MLEDRSRTIWVVNFSEGIQCVTSGIARIGTGDLRLDFAISSLNISSTFGSNLPHIFFSSSYFFRAISCENLQAKPCDEYGAIRLFIVSELHQLSTDLNHNPLQPMYFPSLFVDWLGRMIEAYPS